MTSPSVQPKIHPDFLPPQAPPTASAHQIDFEKTNPPLPKYKDFFAATIDNFLTPSECHELLTLAESSTPGTSWQRAMINIGGGKQILATETRNCARIIWDTHEIAARLLARLMPFLREFKLDAFSDRTSVTGAIGRGKSYELVSINERLRFLKYEGGEYFKKHWDGRYEAPNGDGSWYTIQIYLNGEGEQDEKDLRKAEKKKKGEVKNADPNGSLLGGATSFYPIPSLNGEETPLRVFPKMGSVLIFQHSNLLHSGDPVFRGTKYAIRSDIMYREV